MQVSNRAPASSRQPSALEQFASYPFAADDEYQKGVLGIIGSGMLQGKSEEERSEILLRSELFYFNRVKGTSLSLDDARKARQIGLLGGAKQEPGITSATTTASASGTGQGQHMLSFAQLKDLIEQGRTDEIPNNKTIPNVLSSAPPSESKVAPRKKPWEGNKNT
ncbi:hypothetical protein BD413DRAFT_464704 [Trametes elegans]|nr:hypothetical protein BD413DRAFT_464704 [Trametes elegans]